MSIPPETQKALMEHEERLTRQFEERLLQSHLAIDKSISNARDDARKARESTENISSKVNEMYTTFKSVNWKTLQEVTSSVQGLATVKNIFTGLSSVVLALGAIGAGLAWLIKSLIR